MPFEVGVTLIAAPREGHDLDKQGSADGTRQDGACVGFSCSMWRTSLSERIKVDLQLLTTSGRSEWGGMVQGGPLECPSGERFCL